MEENNNLLKGALNGPTMGYIDVFQYREMWDTIAQEVKGEFRIVLSSGNVLESHTLSVPYKKWLIIFSISDTRPLKITVSFETHTDFTMVLGLEDFTDKLLKKLGMKDITLGWDSFDNKYLIKSNKPDLLKSLITPDIQKLLLKHVVYSLSFQDDIRNSNAVLTVVIQRNPGNKELILDLIETCKSLIDKLKQLKIIE